MACFEPLQLKRKHFYVVNDDTKWQRMLRKGASDETKIKLNKPQT